MGQTRPVIQDRSRIPLNYYYTPTSLQHPWSIRLTTFNRALCKICTIHSMTSGTNLPYHPSQNQKANNGPKPMRDEAQKLVGANRNPKSIRTSSMPEVPQVIRSQLVHRAKIWRLSQPNWVRKPRRKSQINRNDDTWHERLLNIKKFNRIYYQLLF